MWLLSVLLLLVLGSSVAAEPGEARLARELFRILGQKQGNLFFSPASIRLAVAMSYAGARGATATELAGVLGDDPKTIHKRAGAQLRRWATLTHTTDPASKRVQLTVANRMWIQADRSLDADFETLLKGTYRAGAVQVDFVKQPEPARTQINEWVGQETKGRIPSLLPAGSISNATRVVLVDTIYFKAAWRYPFDKASTTERTFHAPGRDLQTPTMYQGNEQFAVARIKGGQILELPYGAGDLAMDIVLPTARDGLPNLEHALAEGALPGWLSALSYTKVYVHLPRWKSRTSVELRDTLRALGAKSAFDATGADFSGIDGTHPLVLSRVDHEAEVDVTEQGTEATAATAADGELAFEESKPVVFQADHPFVYLIRDTKTGAILFLGRLTDP